MEFIYKEKVSGATINREKLHEMINNLKAEDTIYVTDLTRITRSTKDLFLLIEKIKSKGANLKSLKDTWITFR